LNTSPILQKEEKAKMPKKMEIYVLSTNNEPAAANSPTIKKAHQDLTPK
jgi:hypothetical protein